MKEILKSFAVLAVVVGIVMYAFNQTFGIGLVILLGLFVMQLILSRLFNDLRWNEFDSPNLESDRFGWDYLVEGFILNFVFNLTFVGTIISTFFLLFKSGVELNNSSNLVEIIVIISVIISIVVFFICMYMRGYSNYEYIRAALAISVFILLSIFSYWYFGTQIIWVSVLLGLGFSFNKCFEEIDSVLEYNIFSIFTPILLIGLGLISTLIQFWTGICNLLIQFFTVIYDLPLNFFTFEFLFIPLWLYLLFSILTIVTIKITMVYKKKRFEKKAWAENQVKIENIRKVKEDEAIKEKETKAKEEKQLVDDFNNHLKKLVNLKDSDLISKEDVNFVVSCLTTNNYRLEIDKVIAAKILTHADLFDVFVTVSEIKEQIFYESRIATVLVCYNLCFCAVNDDVILRGLIDVISNLAKKVEKLNNYKGYNGLSSLLSKGCKDFPQYKTEPVDIGWGTVEE